MDYLVYNYLLDIKDNIAFQKTLLLKCCMKMLFVYLVILRISRCERDTVVDDHSRSHGILYSSIHG